MIAGPRLPEHDRADEVVPNPWAIRPTIHFAKSVS